MIPPLKLKYLQLRNKSFGATKSLFGKKCVGKKSFLILLRFA